MNIQVRLLLSIVLLILSGDVKSQKIKRPNSTVSIVNQKIGDQIPDVLIPKIINDKYAKVKTSVFKDQLLIIDFWFTSCSSCVASLPKMMGLQKEFGDRIKVLPVTFEKEGMIREFLKTSKVTRDIVVPTVVEDKVLSQLFKHVASPHEVWIYKGKVVAVTEADYVTSENIKLVLNGEENDWPVKNDFLPQIDLKTPLVRQDLSRFSGRYPLRKYVAVFGCYQDGVSTEIGTVRDSVSHLRRDYIINLPVINTYITRWNIVTGNSQFPKPSQIILEVKDPTRYVQQEDSKEYNFIARQKTFISYESVSLDTGQTEQMVAQRTIADLDNLLELHGRYEKRKVKCLVLVRIDSIDKIRSKTKNRENMASLLTPHVKFSNQSLSNSLIWKMNQFYGNPPVFDETGYSANVDMEFTLDSWQNILALRKILQSYGLDLREEERDLEVFVLTEKMQINDKKI